MAAEEDDHKDLREVKTVLHALQRIGNRPPQVVATGKNPGNAAVAVPRAGARPGDAESPSGKRPVQGRRLGALALAMLAVSTVIVLAGDLFLKYWPSSPSAAPAPGTSDGVTSPPVTAEPTVPVETSRPAPRAGTVDVRPVPPAAAAAPTNPSIANAHQLMDSGRIVAARAMLSRPDLAASQEGAWLLARSYDPGYLATVQSPDASADQRQAEEWYRRWRDIAARNGMVMDDLRFQRIINAMRSFGAGDSSSPQGLAPPGRN